jgi:hypothetical protein
MVFTRRGWFSRLPLRVLFPLWLLVSQGVFLLPLSWSSGDSFLPISRVVKLLFLPARSGHPVEADHPLALLGYYGFVYRFFFRFGRFVHRKMSSLGKGLSQSVVDGIFWPVLSLFFFWFWKLDLHVSPDFWLTRAPQPRSLAFSAPAAASTGRIGRRWSACGVHGPGSSLLLGARVVTLHLFSGRARWLRVLRRRIFAWVGPVTARVLHAPPSGGSQPPLPLPATCFGFSAFCVFLSCLSPVSACLCLDQIL